MPPSRSVVAFAKRNQTLTIVIAGAGLVTAFFALRGFGSQAAPPAPTPAPTPAPSPAPGSFDTSGGSGSGSGSGGGASAGLDLAALVAALSGSQQSGAGSGVALGQAGLQAGVDLGTAGLQTGANLGIAGLQVGSDLGQSALGLASDVTGVLGSALGVSVGAQAYQTVEVTSSLTKFLAGLQKQYLGVWGQNTPGGSSGKVSATKQGARPASHFHQVPGVKTPAGYVAAPRPPARPAPRHESRRGPQPAPTRRHAGAGGP